MEEKDPLIFPLPYCSQRINLIRNSHKYALLSSTCLNKNTACQGRDVRIEEIISKEYEGT